MTLRDPKHPNWPAEGERTEDEEVARRWAWAYVDLERDDTKRRHLGIRKGRKLGEASDEWLRVRERDVADATLYNDRTLTRKLIHTFGRNAPVSKITTADMQSLWDRMHASGLKPSSLRSMRFTALAFFGWCEGLNPATDIQVPEDEQTEDIFAWTDQHIESLRDAADARGWRLMFEVFLATGVRVGEGSALRWEDFTQSTSTVRITRQYRVRNFTLGPPKSGKGRTAVVLPFWWAWHKPTAQGLIFDENGPVRPTKLAWRWEQLLLDTGLYARGRGAHDARRTYGRLFLEMGGWMDELQTSLGHGSIATTERQYAAFAAAVRARYAVERMRGGRGLRLLG